ncbi:hypothetical protein ACIA6C_28025 [Streptomyces sp. NPDC051578]|uniref:hypothetical protein n=1 Tax=Streptomyces sp. NPDC051578 TaxID=3365662 RepID=UPI0037A5805B
MASTLTTQPTPARRLVAADSDPSMDEALARVRRIEALDEDTRRAASYVRRQSSAA